MRPLTVLNVMDVVVVMMMVFVPHCVITTHGTQFLSERFAVRLELMGGGLTAIVETGTASLGIG